MSYRSRYRGPLYGMGALGGTPKQPGTVKVDPTEGETVYTPVTPSIALGTGKGRPTPPAVPGAETQPPNNGADKVVQKFEHGQPWVWVRPGILTNILARLAFLHPSAEIIRKDQNFGMFSPIEGEWLHEGGGEVLAVLKAINRMGNKPYWDICRVTDCGTMNVGYIADSGRHIWVHQELYNLLNQAAAGSAKAWAPSGDGSVWIVGNADWRARDYILDRIAKRLIHSGYLAAPAAPDQLPYTTVFNVAANDYTEPFKAAMRRLVTEVGATWYDPMRVPMPGWGTAVMLRVAPSVLDYLESGPTLGEATQMRAALPGFNIAPGIWGGELKVT